MPHIPIEFPWISWHPHHSPCFSSHLCSRHLEVSLSRFAWDSTRGFPASPIRMNHGITNSKSDVYFSKGSTIFKPREASSRHVVTLTCWNTLLPWTTNTKTKLHNNHQSNLKISGPHITCSVVRASGHTSSQRAWMMGGSVSVQTASGKLCASYSYSEIMHISRMCDTYCRLGSMEALLPKRSTKTNMHFLWTVEDNVVRGHRTIWREERHENTSTATVMTSSWSIFPNGRSNDFSWVLTRHLICSTIN